MRPGYSTITPAVVRSTAAQLLRDTLHWQPYGLLVTVARLLDLVLFVAALRSSLSAVARRFRFGFSHETARTALYANLPTVETLTAQLIAALSAFGLKRRQYRRRTWILAIDEHQACYYGDPATPGIVGGKKKQGTKYFYGYATAALVHHRHRYVVGLLALTGGLKPHQVVAALLAQVAAHGLRVRGVVLDSGFDSGDTILLLQKAKLAYTVPLRRKGTGTNRRNECFTRPPHTRLTVSWTTEVSRRPVTTAAVVGPRRPAEQVKVYAYGGWTAATATGVARLAKRWYRKRFGIETSYRQMNEGKGRTTATSVAYRLLLVGLALLLRQIWVWLSGQVAADRDLKPTAWVAELPLQRLLGWLRTALERRHRPVETLSLKNPLWTLDTVSWV